MSLETRVKNLDANEKKIINEGSITLLVLL